jgi:hypothetical protein
MTKKGRVVGIFAVSGSILLLAAAVLAGSDTAPQARFTLERIALPRTGVIPPVDDIELKVEPNPMTTSTRLMFAMPEPGRALLEVFSARGTLLARRSAEDLAVGAQSFGWDGTDTSGRRVPAGAYYARLTLNPSSGGSLHAARRSITVVR